MKHAQLVAHRFYRGVVATSMLLLVAAGAPHQVGAQPSPAALADSARRLDSLASSLRIWVTPTPDTRRRAVALWAEAASLYRRAGDRQREMTALIEAGRGDVSHDTARSYLTTALDLAHALGDRPGEGKAILWLGVLDVRVGAYDSALTKVRVAARIAREVGDAWGESRPWAFYWVAHTLLRLSQLDSSAAYYREAVRVARETGEVVPEAGALGDIGNIFYGRGRYDSALVYFHGALAGFQAVGHHAYESSWLHNIGNLHSDSGRPDSAVVYYRRSIVVAREAGNRPVEAAATIALGGALSELGQFDSAAAYYREGLRLAGAIGDQSLEGYALANLGAAQHASGQRDSALVTLRRALVIARELGEPDQAASTLAEIGAVHAAAGRPDSARSAYGAALTAARAAESLLRQATVLRSLGDLHARQLAPPDLARAVAYYDSASAVRASILASAGMDARQVSFAETGAELFERWALAWLARAEDVGPQRSALAALAVAERGRAQALLTLLRRATDAQVTPLSGDRSGAGPQAALAGADLAQEGRDIVQRVRAWREPVITHLVTRDTLIGWIISPSGTIAVTRRAVPRDSLMWLIAAVRAEVGSDPAGARALQDVDATENAEHRGDASDSRHARAITRRGRGLQGGAADASRRLTDLLLPRELARRLPASGELLIIPHGPLGMVPFTMLRVRTAQDTTSPNEELGSRFAIHYAPSFATLALVGATARSDVPAGRRYPGALVIGNPTMPVVTSARGRSIRLPSLPGAEREGRWVSRALGVTMLSAGDATEQAVRDRLPDATVVHLATHGLAFSSDARMLDSFVALSPDSLDDGLLTVGEVIDRVGRLRADLVVLSACQTGLGNLKQAEGTVGLQRAFLAKGARSVLVSLWSVSDEATELLMRRFYTHWLHDRDGPDKAEALRRAQGDVRAIPRFRAPRYWAAFQLVGAP